MDIIHPGIEAYAEKYTTSVDELLQEIDDFTKANHKEHHMLSGMLQGRFLQAVSYMIHPKRVLEIGTFTGYSALCLAHGLTAGGELHTIELRDSEADVAAEYFKRSVWAGQIHLHRGRAAEIIPTLKEEWDLVFIDADKVSYIDYFNLVFPKVRKNGFILADNIFFHGEVIASEITGKSAKAIQAFNDFLRARTDIDVMTLTLRDGVSLIRKL